MKQCLLCGGKAERLARAHILPRGFFRNLPTKARVNTVSLPDGTGRKLQNGLYDADIICDDCEHDIMQPLDDYGIQVIRDRKRAFCIPVPDEAPMGMYVFEGVDKRKIQAFLASVLWRCSVSKQLEVSHISLGPYEERIRQDLLVPGEFTYIDMVLCYLTHPVHGAFLLPHRTRLKPIDSNRGRQVINGWELQFPNITVIVSLDKRSHPYRMFFSLKPDITGRTQDLRVSSCLNVDDAEYNLLALESEEIQENTIQYLVQAMQLRDVQPHKQAPTDGAVHPHA